MSEFDLSTIPSDAVKSVLIETIENILKTKNFKIKLNPASKRGDNYIGIVHQVKYVEKNDKSQKSSIILKIAPTNLARREHFFVRPYFLREIYIYDTVLPYFNKFQHSKGVNVEKKGGFNGYPECLSWHDVDMNECLVLEDLTVNGFKMIDHRKEIITVKHIELVMRSIGKFHAISFALRDQQPEKFTELKGHLNEIYFEERESPLKNYLDSLKQTILNTVSAKTDEHLADRLNNLLSNNQFDIAVECVRSGLAEPYAVICHGDLWSNNMMFSYNNKNEPTDVYFIDWQITRYASPITDLVFYLFCCVNKKLRDIHYDKFLRTYHESLSDFLKRLGSDPLKLFPYDVMLEHFQKFGKFGLVMATMLLPRLTCEERSSPDLDEIFEKGEMNGSIFITNDSTDTFNKQFRDLIVDMIRLNYF